MACINMNGKCIDTYLAMLMYVYMQTALHDFFLQSIQHPFCEFCQQYEDNREIIKDKSRHHGTVISTTDQYLDSNHLVESIYPVQHCQYIFVNFAANYCCVVVLKVKN